jgi:hypothetical protein
MPNITESFANYMEAEGYGTLGIDLYIGGIPLDSPNQSWWILSSGGGAVIKASTNNKLKNYMINVYYRDTDAQNVYNTLQAFEETINSAGCPEISGYDVIEAEVTLYPTDQDIDNENRTIGLAEVTLTVYS